MKKIVAYGLGIIMLLSVLAMMMPTSAQIQMADEFGVENAMGDPNTYVEVPVNITNVQNGPIQTIMFDVIYNSSVLELVSIKNGDLTPLLVSTNLAWTNIILGGNKESITLNTPNQAYAIANGSSGSVVLLNFSVKNVPGGTSPMNMSNIDFGSTSLQSGTALPMDGKFTITGQPQTPEAGATVTPTESPGASPTSPVTTAPSVVTPSSTKKPTATPTPTPEEPGFEAVFAIAGLLAIAYLVLRRKK